MARDYLFTFGVPGTSYAGLAPTFTWFVNSSGATKPPPTITETPAGSGFYKSSYGSTVPMFFTLDGFTTGLATSARFINGMFDPYDQGGETLVAMGVTLSGNGITLSGIGITLTGIGNTVAGMGVSLAALGVSFGNIATLIGSTSSSMGSTSVDPASVFGFLIRAQEFREGNRAYTKSTGILDYYSRGSSTLLIEKTVSDNTAGTTCI